jgi:ATP-binding cassette subfamily B protein
VGKEIVPRAQQRGPARGIGLKSVGPHALIGLEKRSLSRQGVISLKALTRWQISANGVNGPRMTDLPKKITDDPYGAAILIRRLITEQGLAYWRRYLLAFALMGVGAATTAGSAYLLGQVINKAYVDKDVRGIVLLSLVTIVIFTIKGAATYGHTVILSKISNAILANNQRRLFAKLMSENIAFFSNRHSSEFLARLTTGTNSVTQVLNLLINAIGRDVLSLIALVVVMLMTDPYMAILGFAVTPPAMLVLRKLVKRIRGLAYTQFTGTADILETMQEALQGIRTVKAFTLEGTMRERINENIASVERNANKMARISNRSSPLMETLGGFAIAAGLMYGGYSARAGRDPRAVLSFLTAFCWLPSRPNAGAAQH